MILIGLILTYLLGFFVVCFAAPNIHEKDLTAYEVTGLSFLFGIGSITVFMFLFDLAHIKITALSLTTLSVVVFALIFWKRQESIIGFFRNISKSSTKIDYRRMNLPWGVIFIIILFLMAGSVAKSLYWPTAAYDSVAGYDLMGKVIAAEGKIHVSLFDIGAEGKRGIYPPLIPGSFAFARLFGSTSSKVITSLTYISLLLIFYALLRRYVTSLSAIAFTLLMIVTPEMFAHSSLSLSNVPAAAYAAPGLIYLFLWVDKKDKHYLYFASIFLGLNVWTRSDGIVFNLASFLLMLYYAIRNKSWKEISIYTTISFLPFLCWAAYLKFAIGVSQDRFVDHLFWDADRFQELVAWIRRLVFNPNLYGLTFYIFSLTVVLNIKNLFRDKLFLLLLIVVSFLFYSAIYYQFDDLKQGPLDTMMQASYKRALFYFVPLVLFYAATNKGMQRIFLWIDDFRTGKK